MLPKRKIIKKTHRRPQQAQNNACPQPGSLLERLRSPEQHHIEEALAYISSMCYLGDSSQSIALLAELVAILIRGPTGFVYQCLYALSNLVEVEPSIVGKLFQLGLQKALKQLNSNDSQLLRPILALMSSLHGAIPSQFLYLERGVQQSLTPTHLAANKQQVLRYFHAIESTQLRDDIYEKIYQFFKNQEKLAVRSLSASILLKNNMVREKIAKDILQYCEEVLCDIDLQKQYTTNLVQAKPPEKPKEAETDMIDQEEEILINQHPNAQMFNDALQAAETLLEGLLLLFQEGVEDIEEEEECEGEEWDNEIEVENAQGGIQLALINFFNTKYETIAKNIMLTFPEGQNIVHLNLRLLGCCKIPNKQALSFIICRCFENMLQVLKPQLELQQEILLVGLHMLLKCPVSAQAREMLLYLGQSVLQVSHGYKDAWLRLLELYSTHYNPEKCAVSPVENRRVGAILMNLIVNIPEMRLQEWRGQAIDTVFDVFSNEQFDGYLSQLGLLGLLEKVAGHMGGKKTKFVREVVTDIQRFLEYKKKMMKF